MSSTSLSTHDVTAIKARRQRVIALLDRCDERDVRDNIAALMRQLKWDLFDDELLEGILTECLSDMNRRKKHNIENRRAYAEYQARAALKPVGAVREMAE